MNQEYVDNGQLTLSLSLRKKARERERESISHSRETFTECIVPMHFFALDRKYDTCLRHTFSQKRHLHFPRFAMMDSKRILSPFIKKCAFIFFTELKLTLPAV